MAGVQMLVPLHGVRLEAAHPIASSAPLEERLSGVNVRVTFREASIATQKQPSKIRHQELRRIRRNAPCLAQAARQFRKSGLRKSSPVSRDPALAQQAIEHGRIGLTHRERANLANYQRFVAQQPQVSFQTIENLGFLRHNGRQGRQSVSFPDPSLPKN